MASRNKILGICIRMLGVKRKLAISQKDLILVFRFAMMIRRNYTNEVLST